MDNRAVPLARARTETKTQGSLTVSSSAFSGSIPKKYSEYADGISPPISWSAVPDAKSYALILEDPDAKAIIPFVHWVAFNIPADVTTLREGLHGHGAMGPIGVRQGMNSRGAIGYFGPRPPVGDPPHHYHFQIFALDSMLAVPPACERDAVLSAMDGRVLAAGELVGIFQQPSEFPA